MFSIVYNRNLKVASPFSRDCKTDAVDGDEAFFDQITHYFIRGGEAEKCRSAFRGDLRYPARPVDVTLHEMAAQLPAETQGPFQVDWIPAFQKTQIGAADGLGT